MSGPEMTDQTETVVLELTTTEAERLSALEATIDRGMRTFVEVGHALAEIRDARLYRDAHDRFEDYCQERWGFVASRARQLIAAAEVVSLASVTDVTPESEAVARELAPLREEPDKLRAAWQEAVDNHDGKPTAKAVQQIVQQYREPEAKPDPPYTSCPACGQRVRADKPLKGDFR